MADIGDHRWRSQRPGEERPTTNREPIWAEGHTSKSIKVEEKRKCQKCEMDCVHFLAILLP
nr:paired amphipathic helix protein Sin3-like 2 [Ipomoea batatas]GME16770.1 paired amphipathic helix protein Sin3-like 2 [Ipomoea batatas]